VWWTKLATRQLFLLYVKYTLSYRKGSRGTTDVEDSAYDGTTCML